MRLPTAGAAIRRSDSSKVTSARLGPFDERPMFER
jgi:hypothetical protein